MSEILDQRIQRFMGRKAKEYPELHLLDKWGDYEYLPRPKQPKARKYVLRHV